MRKAIFLVHLYVGLTLGFVTVVLGLTGSLLVFRHEIDAALSPNLLRVTPGPTRMPLHVLVDRVRQAYPTDGIGTVNVPKAPDAPVEFWMKREALRVYVDPYSGRVLGDRDQDKSLMGWIFKVHTELFAGQTGEKVAGYAGLALVLLSVTGLVVWWPRKRQRFRDGLVARWSAGPKRFTYDLHRAVGFWFCGVLTVIGLSGAALVFPDQAKSLSYAILSGEPAPGKPKASPGEDRPLSEILAAAERAMPEGSISRLTFPAKPTEPYVVRKRTANELHPNGMNTLYVTAGAHVLRVDRDDGSRPAQVAMNLRYPLHIGQYGGLASRIVHAAAGLAPAVLAFTGTAVWWRKRRKRSLRAVEHARPAPQQEGRPAESQPAVSTAERR